MAGVLVGLSLFAAPAVPQELSPVEGRLPGLVGSRVRVGSTVARGPIVGTLLSMDDEAIGVTLGGGGGQLRIPVDAIESLELATGVRRRVWRGLAIGAAAGLLLGLVDDSGEGCTSRGRSASRASTVACLTVGGAGIGAGIGALVKTDAWTAIVVPAIEPATETRSLAASVSIAVQF